MWAKGEMNGFKYQVKHYEAGSEFGINGGRISKLWISKDGMTVANYDRGWDMKPTGAAKQVYEKLLTMFN